MVIRGQYAKLERQIERMKSVVVANGTVFANILSDLQYDSR
jgi:hypothetical protein